MIAVSDELVFCSVIVVVVVVVVLVAGGVVLLVRVLCVKLLAQVCT